MARSDKIIEHADQLAVREVLCTADVKLTVREPHHGDIDGRVMCWTRPNGLAGSPSSPTSAWRAATSRCVSTVRRLSSGAYNAAARRGGGQDMALTVRVGQTWVELPGGWRLAALQFSSLGSA